MRIRILATGLFLAASSPAGMTAREIVDEQSHRHRLFHETTVMDITLIDRKGHREERTLRWLRKNEGNDLTSSLAVFDAPADIKGTALLTRENAGKPNDQWLYFPSQRRLQRIAQSRRNGYFMGTDFTYEDMDPENIDDYAYTHVESETVDGLDCFVIDAVPVEEHRRASGYGRKRLWIRKDILFSVRIEFYDRKDSLLKTQRNSALKSIVGEAWRADEVFVDNVAKRHQTRVAVVSRDTETELGDDVFSDRHILTGRYMK